MSRLFTVPDAWSGGDFELLLFFGNISEESTRSALDALWNHPSLDGCWLERDIEPEDQIRVVAADVKNELAAILYGVATLPNKALCNCRSVVIEDEDGIWLNLGVPLGGLAQSYPVGAYPFDDDGDLSWIMPLSEWLVDIAKSVFAQNPFKSGVTGIITITDEEEALRIREGRIPKERWNGYLRNECGVMEWYPPNILLPPFSS